MTFNYLDSPSSTKLYNRPRWLWQIITEIPLWVFACGFSWLSRKWFLREILNNPHDIKGGYGIKKKEEQ